MTSLFALDLCTVPDQARACKKGSGEGRPERLMAGRDRMRAGVRPVRRRFSAD
jgi:hypothetical protein